MSLPRPVRFLRSLEADVLLSVGQALADVEATQDDLTTWRKEKKFDRKYVELARERRQPNNRAQPDREVMIAALEGLAKEPTRGLSRACVAAGISVAGFHTARRANPEYEELYQRAMDQATVPIEERHLDTMINDPKDAASRRAYLAARVPGVYSPEKEGGLGGGVTVNVTTQVTAMAQSVVADLPRAQVNAEGRALPQDVPVELLAAGGTTNQLQMLVDEQAAEKAEQAPNGEG